MIDKIIQIGDVKRKKGIPIIIRIKKITNNSMYSIEVTINDNIPNNPLIM